MAQLFSLGIMDTLPKVQPVRRSRKALIWILAALTIALVAFLYIAYLLHGFYLETATLAPGTGIRPMSLGLGLLLSWGGSILFGSFCSLIGGIIGAFQRRWLLVVFAFLAAVFAWLPMFFSSWEFERIVTLRQLVCEP